MFKFLKDKIKGAISKITASIKKEEKLGVQIEEKHKIEEDAIKEKITEQPIENKTIIERDEEFKGTKEKKGLFQKIKETITTIKIDDEKFNKLFWELELALLENNVAAEVIEKIKGSLKNEIVEKPIKRGNIESSIENALKDSIKNLFFCKKTNLFNEIKNKNEEPYVIVFFGINGSGKTTTIAKIANMLKQNKLSCVIAAADTFRAASIEQLQQHGDKLGIKVIKHDYGSDPAAVAFDAIKHAKAKNVDVVLIDTAGRMHSNKNLIDEMKKIVKVSKPDLRIFVGESITGNDCVEQAKTFNDSIGIDGIVLSKVDIDEKGGAAVSVSYITKKPILYFGTGQGYNDLKDFDSEMVVGNLGLS